MLYSRTIGQLLFAASMVALVVEVPCPGESQTPVASASPSNGACAPPKDIDPNAAFAHEIDDARTLAFLSFVENIAPKDRSAVDKRAVDPLTDSAADAIERGLANPCDSLEVDFRMVRLVYMLAMRWSYDEAIHDQYAGRHALAVLYLGDRIPAPVRDAALAVFGTSVDHLDSLLAQARVAPSPAPSSRANVSCSNVDAKETLTINPDYPMVAKENDVTGIVKLFVTLDASGYVRAVTVDRVSLQPRFAHGGTELVTASISAAGSGNYQPKFIGCKAVPGEFPWRAEFSSGP